MPPAPASFTCPDCGSVSFNPNDIQNRYCGRCHSFTAKADPLNPLELTRLAEALSEIPSKRKLPQVFGPLRIDYASDAAYAKALSPPVEDPQTMAEWIQSNGLFYVRPLGDGRATWISRKIFTWAVSIGKIGARCFDDSWCYEGLDDAFRAIVAWDALTEKEPVGWIRHPTSGRRHGGEVRP